jgi:hypothetical protein
MFDFRGMKKKTGRVGTRWRDEGRIVGGRGWFIECVAGRRAHSLEKRRLCCYIGVCVWCLCVRGREDRSETARTRDLGICVSQSGPIGRFRGRREWTLKRAAAGSCVVSVS